MSIGTCATILKKHFANHKIYFNIQIYKNNTNISTIKPLKRINLILKCYGKSKGDINPTILFLEEKNLYLNEKLEILDYPECNLLNKW